MKKEIKRKISDKKWKNMEKLGMVRPKDAAENKRRITEAHND